MTLRCGATRFQVLMRGTIALHLVLTASDLIIALLTN